MKNKKRFLNNTQWVYLYKNICFSHAGVSSMWMKNNNIKSLEDINNNGDIKYLVKMYVRNKKEASK